MKKTMTKASRDCSVPTGREKKNDATKEIAEMGLCRTCVHVKTCTFPDAGNGVWFCEEYR